MALDPRDRSLLALFLHACSGRWSDLEAACGPAASSAAPGEVREALRMVVPFAGYPRAVEAFEVLDSAGLLPEAGPPPSATGDGDALFEVIYGADADQVRGRLQELDPSLARWIREHAYGAVLSGPALDARTRELLAVAWLATTDQPRQLLSHLRGALRCGATREDVAEVLQLASGGAETPTAVKALRMLERC